MAAKRECPVCGGEVRGGPRKVYCSPPCRWRHWAEFIEALADTGNVRASCLAAGVSRSAAYARRDSDPDFAAAWDTAAGPHRRARSLESQRKRKRDNSRRDRLRHKERIRRHAKVYYAKNRAKLRQKANDYNWHKNEANLLSDILKLTEAMNDRASAEGAGV